MQQPANEICKGLLDARGCVLLCLRARITQEFPYAVPAVSGLTHTTLARFLTRDDNIDH